MKKHEGKIAGILGTIIIHLLGAILFVSMKFHSLKGESSLDFILIIEEFMPETFSSEQETESGKPVISRAQEIETRISNIARNLANPDYDPVIDPVEYQDRVKEEMIRRGLLSEDNFIDEWKRRNERESAAEVVQADRTEEKREAADERLPVNFQGPTRVYYELKERFHVRLPIPVYKCEGDGKVTVIIDVSPTGVVLAVRIDTENTSTNDQCLTDTALTFARNSRFNRNITAPPRQSGTITYHFVAQQGNNLH